MCSYRLLAEMGTAVRRIRDDSPCRCSGASAGKGRLPVRYADCRTPLDPRQNDGDREVPRRAVVLPG